MYDPEVLLFRQVVGIIRYRSSAIPYLGYIKANLQIPGIKGYNDDILLLDIPTTTYSEKVSVMFGSKIIDQLMEMMMKGELVRATAT